MRMYKFILGILGMLALPPVLILAWVNPLVKDHNFLFLLCSVLVLHLTLSMTESLMGK